MRDERCDETKEKRHAKIRADPKVHAGYAYIASFLRRVTQPLSYVKLNSSLALLITTSEPIIECLKIKVKPAADGGYSPVINGWYLNTVRLALQGSKCNFLHFQSAGNEGLKVIVTTKLDDYKKDHYDDTFGEILRDSTISHFQRELAKILVKEEREIILAVTNRIGLEEATKEDIEKVLRFWTDYTSQSAGRETRQSAGARAEEYVSRLLNRLSLVHDCDEQEKYFERLLIGLTFNCALSLMKSNYKSYQESRSSIEHIQETCPYSSVRNTTAMTLDILQAARSNDEEHLRELSQQCSGWRKELINGILQYASHPDLFEPSLTIQDRSKQDEAKQLLKILAEPNRRNIVNLFLKERRPLRLEKISAECNFNNDSNAHQHLEELIQAKLIQHNPLDHTYEMKGFSRVKRILDFCENAIQLYSIHSQFIEIREWVIEYLSPTGREMTEKELQQTDLLMRSFEHDQEKMETLDDDEKKDLARWHKMLLALRGVATLER